MPTDGTHLIFCFYWFFKMMTSVQYVISITCCCSWIHKVSFILAKLNMPNLNMFVFILQLFLWRKRARVIMWLSLLRHEEVISHSWMAYLFQEELATFNAYSPSSSMLSSNTMTILLKRLQVLFMTRDVRGEYCKNDRTYPTDPTDDNHSEMHWEAAVGLEECHGN